MSQKVVHLPQIGEVILAKRRGAKNLRLSILPNGKVRVSLPVWVPYASAISFALSRSNWIKQNSPSAQPVSLKDGHRIGKSYRLKFIVNPAAKTTQARLGINSITITSYLNMAHQDVQARAQQASERALKKEAQLLLAARLNQMAARHGFSFKGFQTKRLSSRWGSCSSEGVITLNYFLIQLPWRLIDYVIVHELAHTRHLNHGVEFWEQVESILPDAKLRRREIKAFRPILQPL